MLPAKAADIDSKDSHGRTPLSWAARNGHEAVVKLLLEKATDVGSNGSAYDQTPLWWAAENGHEAAVKLLLEKAVDMDFVEAVLSLATARGHEAVVELLKERISTYSPPA